MEDTVESNSFASRVEAAGFPSLTVAIETARSLRQEHVDNDRMAGPLAFETDLYAKLKDQIRSKQEIVIPFLDIPGKAKLEKTLNLGRLRALCRLAALNLGYKIPCLEGDKGRFETVYQDSMDKDIWGTRYKAKCTQRTGPFWKLALEDQKQLVYLAKRH